MSEFKIIECPDCKCKMSIQLLPNFNVQTPCKHEKNYKKLVEFVKEIYNRDIDSYIACLLVVNNLLKEIGEHE